MKESLTPPVKFRWTIHNILRLIRNIPNMVVLYYRLMLDPRVSIWIKTIPFLALLYFLSPFDLLPDFLIPVIGWSEDIVILFVCMKIFGSFVPRHILDEHIRTIEKGRR